MDIKKRFKNKAFVLAFITTIVTFIYQICGMFGVVPPISEEVAGQLVGLVVNLIFGLGVMINPTTDGIKDN